MAVKQGLPSTGRRGDAERRAARVSRDAGAPPVVRGPRHGDDARIVHRQARSLLEAGHHVTLVSPAPERPDQDPPGLVRVAIPRAVGRRRLHAWRAARAVVRRQVGEADLVLFHDPELVVALARRRWGVPLVWDVHEDYLAHIDDALWIPALLKPLMRVPLFGEQ